MTPTPRINRWQVRTAMVLAVLVIAPLVRGQEDIGDPDDGDVAMAVPLRLRLDEQGFLQSLLGGPKSIDTLREILEFRLQRQLETTDRECHLTPEQNQKLTLAGQGDIKRFVNRVNEARRTFLAVEGERDARVFLMRESKRFQSALAMGVFGEGSLFAKTFAKVISRQQLADAARYRLERELARHRAAIAETVAKLSRSLSLKAEQRRRFESVLAEQTPPPQKSGDSRVAYVMFQAARLPRSKLEPIFDQAQRQLLWKLLESYENIEEFLKDDGFIFDTPPLVRHSLRRAGGDSRGRRPPDRMTQHGDFRRELMARLCNRPAIT